jgi:hypothetical protein
MNDTTTETLMSQGDWSTAPLAVAKANAREVVGEWDITNRQQQFLNNIEQATSSAKLFQAVWNTAMSGWSKKNLL